VAVVPTRRQRTTSVNRNPLAWVGLAGVEQTDAPRAKYWQERLQRPIAGIALLVVVGYLLDSSDHPLWQRVATYLDGAIFIAFFAETIWMMHVSRHPLRYLFGNWMNVVILVSSLASAFGSATQWIALARVLRAATSGMLLAQMLSRFRVLFTRRGGPLLVGVTVFVLLTFGAMFYWLEPAIETYWDGLWLAFITGTTIGYGDMVPKTPAGRVVAAFSALIGLSLLALFTARIVSLFLGDDESQQRWVDQQVARLSETMTNLLEVHEERLLALHREVLALRKQVDELGDSRDHRDGVPSKPTSVGQEESDR